MRKYKGKKPKYPVPTRVDEPTPHLLISFDLGKRKVGASVFLYTDNTYTLIGAEVIKSEGKWTAEGMANAVHSSLSPMLSTSFIPASFVCEWPKKYSTARKFHKDLDNLYDVGHAIAVKFNMAWSETYTPSEWKGNVPKKAHKKRILRELSLEERVILTKHVAQAMSITKEEADDFLDSELSHDLWDAVGIGLFAAARTRKGGTRV